MELGPNTKHQAERDQRVRASLHKIWDQRDLIQIVGWRIESSEMDPSSADRFGMTKHMDAYWLIEWTYPYVDNCLMRSEWHWACARACPRLHHWQGGQLLWTMFREDWITVVDLNHPQIEHQQHQLQLPIQSTMMVKQWTNVMNPAAMSRLSPRNKGWVPQIKLVIGLRPRRVERNHGWEWRIVEHWLTYKGKLR